MVTTTTRTTRTTAATKGTTSNGTERSPPKPQNFEMAIVQKLEAKSKSILQTFLKLDVDRDGFITRCDLKKALHDQFGIALTKEQLDAIFYRFAYFEDDGRDYDSFDAMNAEKQPPKVQEVLVEGEENKKKKKGVSKPSGHQYGIRYSEFVKYMDSTEKSTYLSQSVSSSMTGLNNLSLHTADSNLSDAEDDTVECVVSSQTTKKLKKQLLQLIESHSKSTTSSASRSGGMEVTTLFLKMDTNRNGSVTIDEFQTWLTNMGWKVTTEEFEIILGKYYPLISDGGIAFNDFANFIYELEQIDIIDDSKSASESTTNKDTIMNANTPTKTTTTTTTTTTTKEMIQNAIDKCVDDTKTDRDIIQTIAKQVFKKNAKLLDTFRQLDTKATGKLDAYTLQQAFQNIGGLHISESRVRRLLEKFDLDGDGKLNKSDFIRLMTSSVSPSPEPSLSPSSSSGDNYNDYDSQHHHNKSTTTTTTTTKKPTSPTKTNHTGDNKKLNQHPEEQVMKLVAPLVGHEDEEKCCNIVQRLDQDDIDIILQFRQVLSKETTQLRKVFHQLDTEGTKSLGVDQLQRGLSKMGVKISEEHANHIMKRFDTEGTGKMQYYQFVKLVSSDLH